MNSYQCDSLCFYVCPCMLGVHGGGMGMCVFAVGRGGGNNGIKH